MRRSIVRLILLSIAGFVLSGVVALAQDDVAQANKALVQNAVAEVNAGNWQVLYDLFPAQFMMNQGDNNLYDMTQQDVIGYNEMLLGGMPDLQINADVLIAQNDWIATELIFTGTFSNTLNFFGTELAPTNDVVLWTEMNFWRFENGVIVESWGVYDPAVLFGQLGVFPPMEEEEDSEPMLESPAGYQTLSADELVASYASGMEERNTSLFHELVAIGLGTDDSAFYSDTYLSWHSGSAVEYIADVQVEEDMTFTGMIATAMPDYVINTPIVVAEGDWLATLANITGTFTEDTNFFGMPLAASGESVNWQLGILYHYDNDGKIIEIWNQTDTTSLFVGLGIMSMDEE